MVASQREVVSCETVMRRSVGFWSVSGLPTIRQERFCPSSATRNSQCEHGSPHGSKLTHHLL